MSDGWAARFGAYYAVLRTMHDGGDHVLQTDHQAGAKVDESPRVWMPAMFGHVSSYTAAQILGVGLASLGVRRPSALRLTAALSLSAASHAFIDRRWPVRLLLRATGSSKFAEMQTPQWHVPRRSSVPSCDPHDLRRNPCREAVMEPNDPTPESISKSPMTDAAAWRSMFEIFKQMKSAGFTEQQSLKLLAELVSGMK